MIGANVVSRVITDTEEWFPLPHFPRDAYCTHRRYDENPQCSYDAGRMHFALHVRMGDRREFQDTNTNYFDLLEAIMADISAEVVRKGMAKPLFHVFSETLMPCPSGDEGVFDEFPTWPVGVEKVRNGFVWSRFGVWRLPSVLVVHVARERFGFLCTNAHENPAVGILFWKSWRF